MSKHNERLRPRKREQATHSQTIDLIQATDRSGHEVKRLTLGMAINKRQAMKIDNMMKRSVSLRLDAQSVVHMHDRRHAITLEAERPTVTVARNEQQETRIAENSRTQSLYKGIPSKEGSQKEYSGLK